MVLSSVRTFPPTSAAVSRNSLALDKRVKNLSSSIKLKAGSAESLECGGKLSVVKELSEKHDENISAHTAIFTDLNIPGPNLWWNYCVCVHSLFAFNYDPSLQVCAQHGKTNYDILCQRCATYQRAKLWVGLQPDGVPHHVGYWWCTIGRHLPVWGVRGRTSIPFNVRNGKHVHHR